MPCAGSIYSPSRRSTLYGGTFTRLLCGQQRSYVQGFLYRPIMTRTAFMRAAFACLWEKLDAAAAERQQLLVAMIHLWDKLNTAAEERQQLLVAMIRLWDKLDAATVELQQLRTILGE
jgi:hypothetical protein